uniref:Myb/SANT-like DNA-binding domain-containing protein n=1 Tax=Anolis carolinensis TaxID=28377 RepID=A0A803TZX3_ANOCA
MSTLWRLNKSCWIGNSSSSGRPRRETIFLVCAFKNEKQLYMFGIVGAEVQNTQRAKVCSCLAYKYFLCLFCFSVVVGSITPIHNFHKMSRRGTNWSHGEVLDLLEIWGEQRIQQVLQSSHRNIDTFQVIANEMAKKGHERTPQECRTKTKTLRRDYKKVKENNLAGKEPMTCPFYDELDRIFETPPPPPPERMPNFIYQEEAGGDNSTLDAPEKEGPPEESEDHFETQDQCDPSSSLSLEPVDPAWANFVPPGVLDFNVHNS